MRLLFLISFPITAAAIALGPETLRLIYGPGFESIGPVLIILLAPLPLYSVISFSNVVLAALGRLTFPLVVGTIAAAVNIGLDFVLIANHDAVGAAIANSIAQLVAGLPVLAYAHRLIRPMDVHWDRQCVRLSLLQWAAWSHGSSCKDWTASPGFVSA